MCMHCVCFDYSWVSLCVLRLFSGFIVSVVQALLCEFCRVFVIRVVVDFHLSE